MRTIPSILLLSSLFVAGCEDPTDPSVPTPPTAPSAQGARVDVVLQPTPSPADRGGPHRVVADVEDVVLHLSSIQIEIDGDVYELESQLRDVVLEQYGAPVVVGSYDLPHGEISRLQIFVDGVTVRTADLDFELEPGGGALPSWDNGGMRFEGEDHPLVLDVGSAALEVDFDFGEKMLHPMGIGYKILPTFDAELWSN